MNQTSSHIIRFLLLVVLQSFIFSFLPLFTYAMGFVYIFFILFMPLHWPKYMQLLLAFGIGLLIDLLTGTHGIHAIVSPIILLLREPLLRLILPKYNDEEWKNLNLFQRDIFEFSAYILSLSFIFCLLFYALNFFTMRSILQMLWYVLASTGFTFILLLMYRLIFATANSES